MSLKVLLLGSGELGKEFAISMSRYGHQVIAVDRYPNAPAMAVSSASYVLDMLDGDALDMLVADIRPDIIVPEIEAIRTQRLVDYEARGMRVTPSANAANTTMNRRAIRDLASDKLGLATAPYRYATSYEGLLVAVDEIGLPCVIKPLMSSSGKGQSTVRTHADLASAWEEAVEKGRGDLAEVIVEGFIEFESEITLLTVTQQNGPTLFCPPIGHVQARGDYQWSWQPCAISESELRDAEQMADAVTRALGGAGIWGVEFFLTPNGVLFSELSPRPHDTGMVTLAGTQNLNEFELHARAVLGLPIPSIELRRTGASAVILSEFDSPDEPTFEGLEEALGDEEVDIRIFGKPSARLNRRMGVALASGPLGEDALKWVELAKRAASKVKVLKAAQRSPDSSLES